MRCTATKKGGNPCQGTALAGSPYCFAHHPDLAERRQEGSRRGGEGKANAARARKHFRDLVMEPADINGLLSDALEQVADGRMKPAVGQALASMAKALMSVQETTLLADRLAELEERAGIVPLRRTS